MHYTIRKNPPAIDIAAYNSGYITLWIRLKWSIGLLQTICLHVPTKLSDRLARNIGTQLPRRRICSLLENLLSKITNTVMICIVILNNAYINTQESRKNSFSIKYIISIMSTLKTKAHNNSDKFIRY